MKTKITIAVLAVFVIGVVGVFVSKSGKSAQEQGTNPYTNGSSASLESLNPNSGTPSGTTATPAPATGNTYTMADVAKRPNSTSCWTAINGKVYDVTSWIKQHPGGAQAILGLCGKDGSSAFNGQHGGQARPASELAGFIIGSLAGAPASVNVNTSVSGSTNYNSEDDDD